MYLYASVQPLLEPLEESTFDWCNMNKGHIYFIEILFVTGIAIGSQVLNLEDKFKWLNVARYAIYILTIFAVDETCKLVHRLASNQKSPAGVLTSLASARPYGVIYLASVAALLLTEQRIFTQDFVFAFVGYLLVKYPEMSESAEQTVVPVARPKPSIAYGVGMACSYLEGYLFHIIPSDGADFVGFEENIRALEDQEGLVFPVKKIFIVITKTMYSPPDLKQFNRGSSLPKIESFNCLPDIKKSVAGVKDRKYHNTAYKIERHNAPPVCLAAECATPLHTLYKVLNNRKLYEEIADIDVEEVKNDFCTTLQAILNKSPECCGKCELVYYDHEDPSQNLAEILLAKIKELAPNFEEQILERRAQNRKQE